MLRNKLILFICLLFICCKERVSDRIEVARVFDEYLYLDQIPPIPNTSDSAIFVQKFSNEWAKKRLLLNKAEYNFNNKSYVDSLLNVYRESLLIHYYKEAMIQTYLDTIILDSLVSDYYNSNIENFQLKETIVKLNYIKIKNIAPNIEFVASHYNSLNNNDLDSLEDYCFQFAERFFLGDVEWVSWSDFSKELPIERGYYYKQNKLFFDKHDQLKLEDSVYTYFIFIQDFRIKGSSAPLEYVSSLIRKVLINKRKKEVVDNIEYELIQDAVSNNNFKIYD
tara:strand:+ start:395 stop:1234 length:840 start_codon:yes stop_codon:yes gene_type:complete